MPESLVIAPLPKGGRDDLRFTLILSRVLARTCRDVHQLGVCPNNGVTGLDTPAEVGGKDQQ